MSILLGREGCRTLAGKELGEQPLIRDDDELEEETGVHWEGASGMEKAATTKAAEEAAKTKAAKEAATAKAAKEAATAKAAKEAATAKAAKERSHCEGS